MCTSEAINYQALQKPDRSHKLGQQVEAQHKAAIPLRTVYRSLRKSVRDGTCDTSFTTNISEFVRDQADAASYSWKLMAAISKNGRHGLR
ncbi:hypothetical protein Zmor_018270 [Zophobas morio]|uniref:Uncharacterized protein n=1 Tax=Zophobas morio TaxID=2755281 RepID=A0AA38M2F3_9CUCU|nr:hypothetical protein Zmor_027289 [Zophobas morio]KAJ3652292.1 hypothetical protein Zmor_018270 [Zophobas morio]